MAEGEVKEGEPATTENVAKFLQDLKVVGDQLNEFPERIEKTFEAMFAASNAYTSKLVAIGYASYFGVWTLIRQEMTAGQTLFTALFMLISVLLYVMNEIVAVAYMNSLHHKFRQLNIDKKKLVESLKDFSVYSNEIGRIQKKYASIRPWGFKVSMASAACAVTIMLYALLSHLWESYARPGLFGIGFFS